VAPSSPKINHLLFTDDSLVFFKANIENAQEVKGCCKIIAKLLVGGLTWTNRLSILLKAANKMSELKSFVDMNSNSHPHTNH